MKGKYLALRVTEKQLTTIREALSTLYMDWNSGTKLSRKVRADIQSVERALENSKREIRFNTDRKEDKE